MKKFTIILTLALLVISLAIPSFAAEPDSGNVLIGGTGGYAFVPGLSSLPSLGDGTSIPNQLPLDVSGYAGYAIFASGSEVFLIYAPNLVLSTSSDVFGDGTPIQCFGFNSENKTLDTISVYVLSPSTDGFEWISTLWRSGDEIPYESGSPIVVGPNTYFPSLSSPPEVAVIMGTIEDTNPPGVLTVFSKVAGFLPRLILSLVPMFWVSGQGLTFVGFLAVAALAVGVALLFFSLIRRWLAFRG